MQLFWQPLPPDNLTILIESFILKHIGSEVPTVAEVSSALLMELQDMKWWVDQLPFCGSYDMFLLEDSI